MSIEDDPQMLAAKINSETSVVDWKELEILFARGKVLVVDKQLDLVEVALKVTEDDKTYIKNQMDNHLVFHPELDWVKEHCQPDTPFWATVVAPFVLVQRKDN